MPKEMSNLQDLLLNEIRDLYHAEKQLVKALPKMAKAATDEELAEAINTHLEETQGQVERLEQIFEELEKPARAKACPGMQGIIEEGAEMLKEEAVEPVKDAGIIAAAQRVEHYEIAAYGTAAAFARELGLERVADLLGETLEEEKRTDDLLTQLASRINPLAAQGEEEDELEQESEYEESESVAHVGATRGGNNRRGKGQSRSKRRTRPR